MKRIVLLFLLSVLSFDLIGQEVDIEVLLSKDGSAAICEIWDLDISEGTEWYLVRENLGDIVISDLSVTDENGLEFINEGDWDVDRSMKKKAGRCGIVRKNNGCEICWGLGSHDHHVFYVRYRMSNVVKSLNDFDDLHMQFVSAGIQPRLKRASVTLASEAGTPFTEENCGIWAFGYEGSVNFVDGKIVARTEEPFNSDQHSMILLSRFDKGIFHPSSIRNENFQEALEYAMYGSSYEEYLNKKEAEKRLLCLVMIVIVAGCVLIILAVRSYIKKRNLNMFGVERVKDIGYERELPFGGDLFATRYILNKCGRTVPENQMAGALILRMVKNGQISLTKSSRGKVLLSFSDEGLLGLTSPEKELYDMLKEAAGTDAILEGNEFSRWTRSKRNTSRVSNWAKSLDAPGLGYLQDNDYVRKGSYSPQGQLNARRTIGFKKYLKDFTLLGERSSSEVSLWHEYIVFASLYGIADQVCKELKDIDPKAFEECMGYDYPTMARVVLLSNRMGTTITTTIARGQTNASVGGRGGYASFGGGGGFSGGGFGGGAR